MATTAQLQAARAAAATLGDAFTGSVTLSEQDLQAFKDILIKLLPTLWPIILQILLQILQPLPAPQPQP